MPRSRQQPDPLPTNTLREIQARRLDDADVRALLWEIRRLRGVIDDAERMRQGIERAWADAVGGHLVGLWQLRVLLQIERDR